MELGSRILRQKIRVSRDSPRNPSIMVPIRDIDRRWIPAVKTFFPFAPGNRVNSIVIYHFFCLSDPCRDSEKGIWHRQADVLIASTAEER
jgi:hypothetical protein